MECKSCGNPLRIVKGGHKTTLDSTDITMVHVHGCLNPGCKEKMKEQHRTETVTESFVEDVETPEVVNPVLDININLITDIPDYEPVAEPEPVIEGTLS